MLARRGWSRLAAALIGLFCVGSMMAQSEVSAGAHLRVALVTAAPGAIYWERFGHNAILIENTISGDSRLYNFGWFDFEQENFMLNFARGRMQYMLAATDPLRDIAGYRADDRSVWLQELNLDAQQKATLAERLERSALPENANYRYDYYLNNCSTKVRDALDEVLDGALQKQSLGRGRGESYRSLSLAYARPIPWLAVGIHLGLGPAADRRVNFWEEAFLPLRLRDLVAETQVFDASGNARSLVIAERTLFAGARDDRVPAQPDWFWRFLTFGAVLAALVGFGLRSDQRALRWSAALLAAGCSFSFGLIGLALAGLWWGTDHQIAWQNANLWLFCPLTVVLAWPLWRLRRPQARTTTAARVIAMVVLGIGLLVLASVVLKLNVQSQADWLALLLPWHLMVWLALAKPNAATPAR